MLTIHVSYLKKQNNVKILLVTTNKSFFVKNFNFCETFREKCLNPEENWAAISLRNAQRKLGNFQILAIVWNVQLD